MENLSLNNLSHCRNIQEYSDVISGEYECCGDSWAAHRKGARQFCKVSLEKKKLNLNIIKFKFKNYIKEKSKFIKNNNLVITV